MIGGYRVEEAVGRGGTAKVYRARDSANGASLALKVFDNPRAGDPRLVRLFLQEIRLHARIRHPGLVRAIASGQQGGYLFLAMEYLPGGSLHRQTMLNGPMQEDTALNMALHVAAALHYAWDTHGLVHRDVKPANVLFSEDGDPRLADLGLARVRRGLFEGNYAQERAVGTVNYTSPEQAAGERSVDARADMYGLGTTLYTALTARVPFDGETADETTRRYRIEGLEDPRRMNPALSVPVARLLQRLLSVRPRDRFDTWDAVRQAMEGVRAGSAAFTQRGPSMLRLG